MCSQLVHQVHLVQSVYGLRSLPPSGMSSATLWVRCMAVHGWVPPGIRRTGNELWTRPPSLPRWFLRSGAAVLGFPSFNPLAERPQGDPGAVAQLVARLVRNEKVRGSNPLSSTKNQSLICGNAVRPSSCRVAGVPHAYACNLGNGKCDGRWGPGWVGRFRARAPLGPHRCHGLPASWLTDCEKVVGHISDPGRPTRIHVTGLFEVGPMPSPAGWNGGGPITLMLPVAIAACLMRSKSTGSAGSPARAGSLAVR